MKKAFLSLLGLVILASFSLQDAPGIIKGKVKCIHFYQSGTKQYYTYDNEGRVLSIQKPYGEKETYSYSGNLIFVENFDPRGYTTHDTMVIKAAGLVDSIISEESFWLADYDLDRAITKEVYVPLHGRKRKPGNVQYVYTYNYYCGADDVNGKINAPQPCHNYTGCKWIKTEIGVDTKNDTFYYLNYKYILNADESIRTRTRYYRTGQLYDSIGYTYY
ncbi:MAG TPA: hypothetical protein VK174_14615 [Chitinophagales bacterium]|nr:hypothetical protein [Chitinophagales bacterium]